MVEIVHNADRTNTCLMKWRTERVNKVSAFQIGAGEPDRNTQVHGVEENHNGSALNPMWRCVIAQVDEFRLPGQVAAEKSKDRC